MSYRVAVLAIIVQDPSSIGDLNLLLHEYAPYIVGRLGLPYRQREISVISVVLDAPQDVINALSGKVGRLAGVSSKTAYSNMTFDVPPLGSDVGPSIDVLSASPGEERGHDGN